MLKICVVGLGYVGLPLAAALAQHFPTIGIDIDKTRVDELLQGHDRTRELDPEVLRTSTLKLSTDIEDARSCDVFIVTVPTPVGQANRPDLRPVMSATRAIAEVLTAGCGAIIVYESTVYPGVTEDICGPAIEKISGLTRGQDFFLGYSPERINPGDREHTVDRIIKVIAGENPEVLETLSQVYGMVTTGGVFKAASIKVAEAAKVIENAQRDINIAFMNEITTIFCKVGISVYDVLAAAGTKWNFLKFEPGLVGGHCIGVDPYYLSYLSQMVGHTPQVILSGRAINDGMGSWIADRIHDQLKKPSHVLILGITFKEDVPDLRNSKAADLVRRLKWIGHEITIHDPMADATEAMQEYGFSLSQSALSGCYDAIVAAVPHQTYRDMDENMLDGLVCDGGVIADVKGIWRDRVMRSAVRRWQL